jgi:hypothetical protein
VEAWRNGDGEAVSGQQRGLIYQVSFSAPVGPVRGPGTGNAGAKTNGLS